MTNRQNAIQKEELLGRIRLKLRRRRRYYFQKYLRTSGKYKLTWVAAQRKIKKEIICMETQRYTDRARVAYRANNCVATCNKYLHMN
jgi:hypothetical protein